MADKPKRARSVRPLGTGGIVLPSAEEIKTARTQLRKLSRAGRGGVEALRAKYDALRAAHKQLKADHKATLRDGQRAAKLVASFIAQSSKTAAPAAPAAVEAT